jgi:hypothetical protein
MQTNSLVHHVIRDVTDLLWDRHVDSIVLCAIFTVCSKLYSLRVDNEPLSFKRIIAEYTCRWDFNGVRRAARRVPNWRCAHTRAQVVRPVLIDPRLRRFDNVITFYNEVFIANIKGYVTVVLKPQAEQLKGQRAARGGACDALAREVDAHGTHRAATAQRPIL